MGLHVAIAFSVAGLAVLVVGAIVRKMARRGRWQWPRRSGGVVLVVTVPVGLLVATAVPDRALAVVGGALILALVGLARDGGHVPRWVQPVVLVAVAVAVASSGMRFPLAGVPDVDFAWTVIWLVVVSTTVAASGNADGQLPSLASASALGIVALTAFAHQSAAATLVAALMGGMLGFLAYNVRPASLFMGRAGALFAGFIIAAGAIWVRPAIGRPDSLLVNVMLVAVPLLDGLVVVISRLRRGRRLTVRVRDHLSHRLVAAGLSPAVMIGLVAGVQAALSVMAVFIGRGVLTPLIGGLVGGVLLVGLVVTAMRARMSEGHARGFSAKVWLALFGLVAFVILASLPAAATALSSRKQMLRARDSANAAIEATRSGDTERAVALFAAAERDFATANDRLGSIANVPSLVVPIVGSNMHAARELARVGVDLARAGRELSSDINSEALRIVDGRVPLETVATVEPKLENAAQLLTKSDAAIRRLRKGYLVGELQDGVAELGVDLADAARDASRAATTARIAPLVLGQGAPRRYLLVVQNPAEVRGTGGLIGNWGILTASNGTIHLESLERVASLNALGNPSARVLHAPKDYVVRYERFDPARTMQNVNISPDFPTVAAVMTDLYAQSASAPVDGVVAVDPKGLAALMQLTGPVRVPDWKTPITSANVVDVTLRDAYAEFARTPERADFLGDVARATIDKATSGVLGNPSRISNVLGKAAHEGHISLWFAAPDEQRVVDEIKVSGRVPTPRGDLLAVSNTNAGANKLDYYLERGIDYSVTVTPAPDLRGAVTEGTLDVELANTVPASGIAQIAAGPYEGATDRFVYGQNHSFISVYTPLTFTGARVDDKDTGLEAATELGRNVYSTFVDVFAQSASKFSLDVAGDVRLGKGGWYELTLVRQPTLRSDRVTLHIAVPDGYEVVKAPGLEIVDGVAQGVFDLDRTRTVRVKIGPSGDRNLWERLQDGA